MITAASVPNCMTATKAVICSGVIVRSSPIHFSARIKWPVLLIGMNSVRP
jgi:hypothetical protein